MINSLFKWSPVNVDRPLPYPQEGVDGGGHGHGRSDVIAQVLQGGLLGQLFQVV